ncbi:MAG: histidine kinase N-terminal 7TM domain-containing protein [Clostridia bacterium]|nr:histidine kinase N-terminal 7TM domain-containing protein [Clostridia bacterium]
MIETVLLACSIIISMILIIMLRTKFKKNKLAEIMSVLFILITIWCSGIFVQKLFIENHVPIDPIYPDYVTYIGICFLFPTLLILSFYYENAEVKKKKWWKWWKWLYLVPFISIISLWTNDLHHLFYKVYSTNFTDTEYGIMFYVNTIYSYSLAVIFIVKLIRASIAKSGFFTTQTMLMIIGSIIPLVVNMFGTAKIINISIYITPMLFFVTLVFYSIAIIKYKALNITPVALESVTNIMSDAFVVISDDGSIVDFNLTFKKTFDCITDISKDRNLFKIIEAKKILVLDRLKELIKEAKKIDKEVVVEYTLNYENIEKYFEVDIQAIKAKKNTSQVIGTLLLFKDITQHKKDIQEIKEKQDIIVKQGQLVSIGELAGGVAHDINTPISAIKTGIMMLNSMPNVTPEQKEILDRMDNCSTKIINIVNSMRNQIRNLGSDNIVKFKISDVLNDVKVITYHEVSKNNVSLNVTIEDDLYAKGDSTKLGQVFTNLIVNAAQAYKDKGQGKIEVTLSSAPNNLAMIKVTDYAGGISDDIKPYIFKNILTTKGTSGTGLGLYLAYSVVKGNFNGDITYESEKGVGTTFYVTIPIA